MTDDGLVTATELAARREQDDAPLVVDVRSAEEFAAGHLPEALHVPLHDLPTRLAALPRGRPVVTC